MFGRIRPFSTDVFGADHAGLFLDIDVFWSGDWIGMLYSKERSMEMRESDIQAQGNIEATIGRRESEELQGAFSISKSISDEDFIIG